MHVTIVEVETGKVVTRTEIVLGGANYRPSDDEYIAEAWRAAVEDNLVVFTDREMYRFTIA